MAILVCEQHGSNTVINYIPGRDSNECPMCALSKERDTLEGKVAELESKIEDLQQELAEASTEGGE